jgi:hypothetical protein
VQSRPSPNHITDANPALPYAALMNQTCASPIVPLTDNKTVVKAAINALSATGETYIPGGLIWGLNVLSPLAPFSEGGAYDAQNRKPRKALVLMTDGVNTKSLNGTMHTGSNRATADTATTQLCAAVKGRGIEVFTVAFMVTDRCPDHAEVLRVERRELLQRRRRGVARGRVQEDRPRAADALSRPVSGGPQWPSQCGFAEREAHRVALALRCCHILYIVRVRKYYS